MKKVVLIIIIIVVLGIIVWGIRARMIQQADMPQTREAQLYATTVDDIPVFKDSTGMLWEVDWLKEVSPEDSVLLEIVHGRVNRTWVQIIQTEPETEIEG